MNIEQALDKTFDAISLLIAFSTILFGIRYSEVQSALNQILDPNKPSELKIKKNDIKRTLWFKWIPVVLLSFIPAYSMFPITFEIVKQSHLNLISFDTVRTAFFLTWIVSLLFFISAVVIVIQLWVKGRGTTL